MPIVTPGDLHVNRELTNVMVAYTQEQDGFVASSVFPNIPTDFQTDFFYKFGRRSQLQTKMERRAPGTETPGVGWNVTKDTFHSEVWGLHHDIDDQLRANADTSFRLEQAGTELLTQQALIRREREWMRRFFVSGVWSTNLTGTETDTGIDGEFVRFNIETISDPITLFREQRLEFKKRTGMRPNVLVFGAEVWSVLTDHPDIVERVKYTQGGFLTEQIVARAIGINNITVADAIETTDESVELTADLEPPTDFIAGKHILMAYRAPRPSRNVPSAGYTFSWRGYAGADAYGGRMKKFRMEPIASDRLEIEAAYDHKQVAPELGVFFENAVTP